MAFRVSLSSNGKTIPIPSDGNTIFGRGDTFGITDRRVSRRHGEIIVSKASKTVGIRPLNVNPSFVIRAGQSIPLTQNIYVELRDGDIISLINGVYLFKLNIEIETEMKEVTEDPPDEMTQVDYDTLAVCEGHKRNKRSATYDPSPDDDTPFPSPKKPRLRQSSDILINFDELKFTKTIGVGTCGEVSEYNWRGTKVAVKKISKTLLYGNNALKEFQAESEILRRLRHPNIVLFMGTCIDGKYFCIVTEYIELGSLRDVLQKNQDLLFSTAIKMAIDAARGMNYLHTYSPPIIHRDLKSGNLLVDGYYHVKVADFGLAKFQTDQTEKNKTFCGTLLWTAPEVFSGNGYTEKADIYSFSIVLWELATKQEPYQGLNPPDIILGVTKQFLRPPIPQDCHPLYVELMKDCWAQEASTRPSFIEILQRLELLDPEKNKDDFNENSRMEEISDVTPMNLTTQFQTVKDFRPMKWQIDPTQLKFLEDFREASNANFYKGIYNNNPVIIKVLKEPQEPNENFDEKEFQIELDILSSVRSDNIAYFFGYCKKPKYAFVIESQSNLYEILESNLTFTPPIVYKLARELLTGIHVLHAHNPTIIHRDLKPQNLLVTDDFIVKLSDFGFAKFYTGNETDNDPSNYRGSNTIYSAPECYLRVPSTTKSDIYSFGILLWEVLVRFLTSKHQKPFSEFNLKHEFQIRIKVAKNFLRPTIPKETPEILCQLIQACWHKEPQERPTTEQILQKLNELNPNSL